MWCAHCQQDVPAVARSTHEPLLCPRCQHEFVAFAATTARDTGIALESFDQAADVDSGVADQGLRPPTDWFEQEQNRQRLRAIDRILHAPYRQASAGPSAGALERAWLESPSRSPLSPLPSARCGSGAPFQSVEPLRSVARRAASQPARGQTRTMTSWLLSAMLSVGVLSFGVGGALLAWSAAFQLPPLWQQGMALTIGAEGLLILSLTWMAARLWRNSRQLNRQLHGVDRQLAEIEQHTATLAGNQSASSQHFYHHFSQVANPHLLMANLQGQVDQLAARVAVQ